MSKLSDFLKSKGAKIASLAVKGGLGALLGGPKGAISAIAKEIGLPEGSDEEAILEAAKKDPSAIVKIKEFEKQLKITEIEAGVKETEADLFTVREMYSESQQTARVEAVSDDSFVRRTRPLIVRCVFGLTTGMILFMVVAAVADYMIDTDIIDYCKQNNISPTDCELDRNSYLKEVGGAYASNWPWISLVIGILPGYFGSRGFEKLKNKDDTDRGVDNVK